MESSLGLFRITCSSNNETEIEVFASVLTNAEIHKQALSY